MKRAAFIIPMLVLFFQLPGKIQAQTAIAYSPAIDSLISLATESTVGLRNRQLSGDTTVVAGGVTQTITTRNYLYNDIQNIAAQFVLEKFLEYGYQARYQDYSLTGRNVLAWKTGTKFPDKKYLICAHYDNMPPAALAPGADDNASGVVAVMEAARLLSGLPSEYTIEFAIWDEEEIGLFGSGAYADSAALAGKQIMGVLNFDMIAWDSNNDYKITLGTNPLSHSLTNDYQDVMKIYTPEFTWTYINIEASDHASFWHHNYPALLAIEEYPGDFNPYYHTPLDKVSNTNPAFFKRMVQASVAGLASLGWNCRMELQHQPLTPLTGTGEQSAILAVISPRPTGTGNNEPCLYFSLNGGNYQVLHADGISGNSYTFHIPAQVLGTIVNYYFAVQDEAGIIIETLPRGGKGTNPPGSTAPSANYTYMVAPDFIFSLCSNSVPKSIPVFSTVYDTIDVNFSGGIDDINVTLNIDHDRISTLNVSLIGPDGTTIDLSSDNGGTGSDFINTTFDDEALIPINNGSASFTGSYKPEQPLSSYDGKNVHGKWILKIQDDAVNQPGMLQGWCINVNSSDLSVGLKDKGISGNIFLGQNFPNPVTGLTSIPFNLCKGGMAEIDLCDLFGRKILTIASANFKSGLNIVNVDLSGLPAGTYFYRLKQAQEIKTKVLVISR